MDNKQGPAVIDMTNIEETREEDFRDGTRNKESAKPPPGSSDVFSALSASMWNEGRKRAETAIKSYTNVDLLRPYFDVEPHEVLRRLVAAFVPGRGANETVPSELYGPVMICFTLVALLLYEMKSSGHFVQEGTLMGSALITCFGYWMGTSAILWFVAYLSNTSLRPMQINTVLGYGLAGHCLVVLLSTLIHTSHSHVFFYLIWAVFGGLCTARMITVFWHKTPGHSERIVFAIVLVLLHMAFLLYLHFAYHTIVEDLAEALNQKVQHKIGGPRSAGAGYRAVPFHAVSRSSVRPPAVVAVQ